MKPSSEIVLTKQEEKRQQKPFCFVMQAEQTYLTHVSVAKRPAFGGVTIETLVLTTQPRLTPFLSSSTKILSLVLLDVCFLISS